MSDLERDALLARIDAIKSGILPGSIRRDTEIDHLVLDVMAYLLGRREAAEPPKKVR